MNTNAAICQLAQHLRRQALVMAMNTTTGMDYYLSLTPQVFNEIIKTYNKVVKERGQ